MNEEYQMKFKFLKSALTGVFLVVGSYANASLIIQNGPETVYDVYENFDNPSLPNHTDVTNQFAASGVTFDMVNGGEWILNGCSGQYGGGSGSENVLNTFDAPCTSGPLSNLSWSIFFDSDVTSVTMHVGFSGANPTNSQLQTVLDGVVIGSYAFTDNNFWMSTLPSYFKLSDAQFDEIRYVSTAAHQYTALESISYTRHTNVPEPSTLAIFALGMIGLASRRFKKQA